MAPIEVMRFEPLQEGVLQRRWKRFLAEVELADGQLVTAHCANTGPMVGVLEPGQQVRLRHECVDPGLRGADEGDDVDVRRHDAKCRAVSS